MDKILRCEYWNLYFFFIHVYIYCQNGLGFSAAGYSTGGIFHQVLDSQWGPRILSLVRSKKYPRNSNGNILSTWYIAYHSLMECMETPIIQERNDTRFLLQENTHFAQLRGLEEEEEKKGGERSWKQNKRGKLLTLLYRKKEQWIIIKVYGKEQARSVIPLAGMISWYTTTAGKDRVTPLWRNLVDQSCWRLLEPDNRFSGVESFWYCLPQRLLAIPSCNTVVSWGEQRLPNVIK